jgi:AcrR family transcriptional regulator
MEKLNNSGSWTEIGYVLFATQGAGGLHIERMAKTLSLNKSSFYHYFGDLDGFMDALVKIHEKITADYLAELRDTKKIEPDYLNLLVKYKMGVMFQLQLSRDASNPSSRQVAGRLDQKQDAILNPIWCEYLGVDAHSDLSIRYFDLVRQMFYSRVTMQNFDYALLQTVLSEARAILHDFIDVKALHHVNRKSSERVAGLRRA